MSSDRIEKPASTMNEPPTKTGGEGAVDKSNENQTSSKTDGNQLDSKTDGNQPDSKTESKKSDSEPSLLDQTTSNATTSEWMRQFFAAAMGISNVTSRLDEVSFEGIARYIKSDKCQKIVTLTGAGISTSAGIPDFRSPGTGVFDRLKEQGIDVPDPQTVFQLEYFTEHPDIVYSLRKEIFCGNFKPTPCHYFVKLLETKNKLSRHFTQNIDGLDIDAGLDPDLVVQAHGTCHTYHCMKCEHPYTKQHMTEVLKDDSLKVPLCTKTGCDGVIRPDIVFFGEPLPARFGERIPDIEQCDLMIIMGTSLVVQPFAALTSRTLPEVPRLYINLEKTGMTGVHPISALIFGGSFDFDSEKNVRDVFWQGTCDEGCYAMADLLGWGDELRNLVSSEHAKIDKKLGTKPGAFKTPAPKTNPTKTPATGKSPQTSRIPPRSSAPTPKPTTNASKPNTHTKNISSLTKSNTPSKPSSALKHSTGPSSTTLSKTASNSKK